jgi:hypothetical protein
MNRQQEFEHLFRSQLGRFQKSLIDELRKVVRAKPPAKMELLLFEIQSDWRIFPVHAFAYDKRAAEVYFKPPFYASLLGKAGRLIPEGVIDQNAFENDSVATFETGARILAEWFRGCWQAAGGDRFPLPAYIMHHDRGEALDLHAGAWVDTESMWQ